MRKISTKVPMISVTRFQPYERMAGAVENTASLAPGVLLESKCCLKASQASTAPRKAPRNSPTK